MNGASKHILSTLACMAFFFVQAWGQAPPQSEQPQGPTPAGIAKRGSSANKLSNPPGITARFSPDSIGIGDQFSLEVEVTQDMMQMVGFPEFHDGKMGEVIEILSEGEVDTLSHQGRKITLRKTYTLTSFEEGWYGLGLYPMLYVDKNITDTIWSVDSLYLKVGTFEIDTATMSIYDIKPPLETPLKLGEISGYLMWGLLALAILILLGWFLFTRNNNMSILGKPKPIIPPHVLAIKALESLHHQKLWQNNKHKLYYTGITDILREYIELRYGIAAMEMTSHEIMSALEDKELPVKSYNDLKELLESADLVKFAKFTPEADANEVAYTNAYYFVEATKPCETEPAHTEANAEAEVKKEEQQ